MPKVIIYSSICHNNENAIGMPSPEPVEFIDFIKNPNLFVPVRKLKTEEIAKVAEILDFSEDY